MSDSPAKRFEDDSFVQALLSSARYDEPSRNGYLRTASVIGVSGFVAPSTFVASTAEAANTASQQVAGAKPLLDAAGAGVGKLASAAAPAKVAAVAGAKAGSLAVVFIKSLVGTALVGGITAGGFEALESSSPAQSEVTLAPRVAGSTQPALQKPERRSKAAAETPPSPIAVQQSHALNAPTPDAPAPTQNSVSSLEQGNGNLAQELALLAAARQALQAGQPQSALVAVAKHAQRFPQGELGTERQVLRIRALELLGRTDESRELAKDFIRNNPSNPHAVKLRRDTRASGSQKMRKP
jgi:hypothetical protein